MPADMLTSIFSLKHYAILPVLRIGSRAPEEVTSITRDLHVVR